MKALITLMMMAFALMVEAQATIIPPVRSAGDTIMYCFWVVNSSGVAPSGTILFDDSERGPGTPASSYTNGVFVYLRKWEPYLHTNLVVIGDAIVTNITKQNNFIHEFRIGSRRFERKDEGLFVSGADYVQIARTNLIEGGEVKSYMERLRERNKAEAEARQQLPHGTETERAKKERKLNLELIRQGARPISDITLTPEEENDLISKGILAPVGDLNQSAGTETNTQSVAPGVRHVTRGIRYGTPGVIARPSQQLTEEQKKEQAERERLAALKSQERWDSLQEYKANTNLLSAQELEAKGIKIMFREVLSIEMIEVDGHLRPMVIRRWIPCSEPIGKPIARLATS